MLNRPEPTHAVGDWMYVPVKRMNARIVGVSWDKHAYNFTGGWRYWAPGYGTLEPLHAITSEPYVEHEEVRPGVYVETGFTTH